MKTEKIRINVADLEVGMYVSELDRDWLDTPFLIQGFMLTDEKQLEDVREICDYVYIDTTLGKAPSNKPGALDWDTKHKNSRPVESHPGSVTSTFEDEIKHAKLIHKQLRSVVDELFDVIMKGGDLDIEPVREVVNEVVNSINRNQYALEWMTQLKNRDEYTAIHCMNVCILSVKLGHHVGIGQDDLNILGICGLLHDIGKIKIPDNILNKPGSLTEEEMTFMRLHSYLGASMLIETEGVPKEVYQVALSHHERMDGTGYPDKLDSDHITRFTRIVAIVDIYDAVTSERVYAPAMPASEATSLLYKLRSHHLDENLVEVFIQCIGVYPVGTLVETDAGEVGLVFSASIRHRMNPSLLVVLDKNKQRLSTPRILNTARDQNERGGFVYNIKRSLNAGSYNIHPRDYFIN